MPHPAPPPPSASVELATSSASRFRWLNWSGFFFAFLQSVCSAFLALHGVRFLVGIGAFVLASSVWHLAERLHVNSIRVPMMILALGGSLFNFVAIWQVRRLRARPASAWRRQPLTPAQQRSESLQLVLSLATLVLLFAEWIAHYTLKGTL